MAFTVDGGFLVARPCDRWPHYLFCAGGSACRADADSLLLIELRKIEPREAFRIEDAVDRDDLAVRNREPHHREGSPLVERDYTRRAIDERRTFHDGRLRESDYRTCNLGGPTPNERRRATLLAAVGSQHHVGIQHCHERVEVAVVRCREECVDNLSLTGDVGVRRGDGRTS